MNKKALLLCPLILAIAGMKPLDPGNRMEAGHAPTPFSAEQIREASPVGHYAVFRIERAGVEPSTLHSEFIEVDEESGTFRGWRETPSGEVIGEIMTATSSWKELQGHSSFPDEITSISEEEIEVPAGSFTCWVYSVTRQNGTIQEMAFAQDMPGPPVRMRVLEQDRLMYQMELVETGTREPEEG